MSFSFQRHPDVNLHLIGAVLRGQIQLKLAVPRGNVSLKRWYEFRPYPCICFADRCYSTRELSPNTAGYDPYLAAGGDLLPWEIQIRYPVIEILSVFPRAGKMSAEPTDEGYLIIPEFR